MYGLLDFGFGVIAWSHFGVLLWRGKRVRSLNLNAYRDFKNLYLMTAIIFLILGISFLISGMFLIREIRKRSKSVHNKLKRILYIATCVLSVSLLLRGMINIIRLYVLDIRKAQDESIENDTWFASVFEIVFFALADFIPIASQLFSMIFGVMRKRGTAIN